MRKIYHVAARWDADAEVWTSSSDVPGLVIETATLAEFEALMRTLIPELLMDNDGGSDGASVEWTSIGVFDLKAA
jgi:hypothetical protein